MAISMHTNYANLVTQNTLQGTNNALSKSMERLSTGFRINSAADDAAGLQIANRLETQSRGMNVAMRNSQDAISMMQTAEGAMDEMTNIAYRMNDLATQAANGTNSADDLAAIDKEFQALAGQLGNIEKSTSFGGTALLGAAGKFSSAVDFQVGATSEEQLSVDLSTEIGDLSTAIGGFSSLAIDSAENALDAMKKLSGDPADPTDSGLIGTLGSTRASFGANINNLNHTMNNLANMSENVQASKGRIMDTDFAYESGQMSKNQMLMQSGAQMLSATKMVPQLAMSMLG